MFLKPTVYLIIFQHLNRIEEQVLESLAWTTVSADISQQSFFLFFLTKNVSVETTLKQSLNKRGFWGQKPEKVIYLTRQINKATSDKFGDPHSYWPVRIPYDTLLLKLIILEPWGTILKNELNTISLECKILHGLTSCCITVYVIV